MLKSLSCASAFARQSRIFDGIDALYAFYRIPKCLNWRNILSWIPFGSDLDPNSDNVFFFFKGERIQISLKAGHHRPASETPFNGVSLACRWWPNVECWLGCSENFRGFDLVFLRGPDPSGSAHGTGQCIHLLRYTENPFYRAHRLLYDTLHTFYRMHNFLNWRNILSWIHSGLIWIQTVFANVNRERERDWYMHIISGKSKCIERSTSR